LSGADLIAKKRAEIAAKMAAMNKNAAGKAATVVAAPVPVPAIRKPASASPTPGPSGSPTAGPREG